jgi:YD repeat-containing protein
VSTVVDASVAGSPNGGTISTVVDLLGRVTSYTDVGGITTTTTYDAAGRAAGSSTSDGTSTYTSAQTFDQDSRVATVLDGGKQVAALTYTVADLTSVSYPAGTGKAGNGTAVTIGRNPTGATTSLGWSFPTGGALSDLVVRSQSGLVLTDNLTNVSTTTSARYTYDSVGRLSGATIPGHTVTYSFAATGGCGVNTRAGADGNRTATSDTPTSGAVTGRSYCYDNADRLTATTVTNPPTGATPTTGTNLTAATLVYDQNGSTTTMADQTLVFDPAGRHDHRRDHLRAGWVTGGPFRGSAGWGLCCTVPPA